MEVPYSCPLQLQNSFLFDCEPLQKKPCDAVAYDPASDPGYFSAASSLSPTSSVDSFCFSPAAFHTTGNEPDALETFIFSSCVKETQPCSGSSTATAAAKKSRSRYPGKKRQTASEREKLRMRDLTKAMHHLRTYLPSSVAPEGQTLTKIETLRLTIRYISYLSAQLGLSEEVLEQRRSSAFVQEPQTLNQFLGQPTTSYSPQESDCSIMSAAQLPSLQQTYQVCLLQGFSALCTSHTNYFILCVTFDHVSNQNSFSVVRFQMEFASAASSSGCRSHNSSMSPTLDSAERHSNHSTQLFSLQQ